MVRPRELQERMILINDDNLKSPAKNLKRPGREMACQTTVEDFRTGASKLLNVSLGKEPRFQHPQVINLEPQNTMDTLSKRTSKTSKKKTRGLEPWQDAMLWKCVWLEPVASSPVWQQLNLPMLQWSLDRMLPWEVRLVVVGDTLWIPLIN